MKRKSLQFKLREIAKTGTLRTYSRDEAFRYYSDAYREDSEYMQEQIPVIRDSYDRGLILCSYQSYEKSDIPTEVSQFTTSMAEFVLNVVYPFVFE